MFPPKETPKGSPISSSALPQIQYFPNLPFHPVLPLYCSMQREFVSRPPMASYSYSNSSFEISTPRSTSPSSTLSRSSTATSISKRMSISGRRISGFNPMAAVDIDAIEAQMKMAALDTLKGYSAEHYGTIKQYRETDYIAERNAGGYQVLREPAWNKGTYLPNHARVPSSQIQKNVTSGINLLTANFAQVHHSVLMNVFPKISVASYLMC